MAFFGMHKALGGQLVGVERAGRALRLDLPYISGWVNAGSSPSLSKRQ